MEVLASAVLSPNVIEVGARWCAATGAQRGRLKHDSVAATSEGRAIWTRHGHVTTHGSADDSALVLDPRDGSTVRQSPDMASSVTMKGSAGDCSADAATTSSPSLPADAHHRSPTVAPGLVRHEECHLTETGAWSCWPSEASAASVGPDTAFDRDLEVFRITADHFRHDLVALWNHSSYFLIIQGALFSVFAGIIGRSGRGAAGPVSTLNEGLFIAIVGLIFALFWSWASWRRVKLIDLWRQNVIHLDGIVDRHGVYMRVEPRVAQRWWFGPSAFTARLPWLIVAMWIIVMCWVVAD